MGKSDGAIPSMGRDLDADTVLVQEQDLVTSMVDGRAAVVSVGAGSCFDFNKVGTEIWTMLAEPKQVDQIHALLTQTYDVDSAVLAREVTAFLQLLVARRLVRVLGPAPAQAP